MWLMVIVCTMAVNLSPGETRDVEIIADRKKDDSVEVVMGALEPGSKYELRVSWPGTFPIRNSFSIDNIIDTSDEKVVFRPQQSESTAIVNIRGIGVSGADETAYRVPVVLSLEKQYIGLTIHVWRVIAVTLPLLVVSIGVALRLFP